MHTYGLQPILKDFNLLVNLCMVVRHRVHAAHFLLLCANIFRHRGNLLVKLTAPAALHLYFTCTGIGLVLLAQSVATTEVSTLSLCCTTFLCVRTYLKLGDLCR